MKSWIMRSFRGAAAVAAAACAVGAVLAVDQPKGAGAGALASVGDWPQWRGPDRKNIAPDQGIGTDWKEKPPKLLWTAEGTGNGYSSLSIKQGKIFTTGNFSDGQGVVALDAVDGKIVWKKSLTEKNPKHGYDGARCTPTLDGDRLYVVTSNGQIACLKTADGEVVWTRDFKDWNGKMMSGWGFSESPLVDGDRVVCTPGGPDALLVALDKTTGKDVWASKPEGLGEAGKDGAGYSSIVVSNGAGVKQYVTVVGRGAVGVRAADGKFLWSYNKVANGTANIPTALVDGDQVFVSTGYKCGSGLVKLSRDGDGVKAEEAYFKKGEELQNHHGGMILLGGYIYLGNGHNNGFPACVKLDSGEIVWGGKLRGPGQGSAAVACVDKHLVFRYESGEVALIEATPEEYRLKGSFKPDYQEGKSWAQPVIVGGKMYLREQNKLMCYDVAQK